MSRRLPVQDSDDWQFSKEKFAALESRYGPHTVDGACDSKGHNALVRRKYFSRYNSFLENNLRGENIWLNPPFRLMHRFLLHYLQSKLRDPTLRMTLVAPAWKSARWFPLLQNFKLVEEIPAGTQLFTAPTGGGRVRKEVGPTPWPVLVLRDSSDRVSYLPSHHRSPLKPVKLAVEVILQQKGRILSKLADNAVRLPRRVG